MKSVISKICSVFTKIEWLEIPLATYVRWVLAILLSVNTILTLTGHNPIPYSESEVHETVSLILNVVVLFVNTYKNNSTSKEALISDKIMHALKAASTSDAETTMGKLQDVLHELNGEDYISSESEAYESDSDEE